MCLLLSRYFNRRVPKCRYGKNTLKFGKKPVLSVFTMNRQKIPLKSVRKRVSALNRMEQSSRRTWQQRELSGFDPTEVIDGEFDSVDLDTVLRDIEFSDRIAGDETWSE